MSKIKRYQLTNEQLERVIDSYSKEKMGLSETKVVTKDPDGDDKSQAPEAKKDIEGSVEGGDNMVTKTTGKPQPKKKDWGRNDEKSHAPEAKKHLKGTVKESEEEVEEGLFDFGKKKSVEDKLKGAPSEFLSKLAEMEKLASEKGDRVIFNKERLIDKAYVNKFRGKLTTIPHKGKVYVDYKEGMSGLQKIAAGSGSMTVGEQKKK